MDWERVSILIDRYLDGETSLDEERKLYALLSSTESLPKEYQAVKAMLGAMYAIAEERCDINISHSTSQPKHRRASLRSIASIAAAIVVVVGISITMLLKPTTSEIEEPIIICHINGTMVDDHLVAQAEVQRILGGVSRNMNSAKERIDNITGITSKKQLQL